MSGAFGFDLPEDTQRQCVKFDGRASITVRPVEQTMNPIQINSKAFGASGIPGSAGGSYAANARRAALGSAPAPSGESASRVDRVELSEQARALATNPTPIRENLVNRIRAEIEAGTYDLDGKLDLAVNELAKDLSGPIDPLENVYA